MANVQTDSDVARYYDFLYFWSQLTNRFRAFSTPTAYAIHRPLRDPQKGDFSTNTIHRMLAEHASRMGEINALDAGCGYGGTCIHLHDLLGGNWHGITINARQYRVAERTARLTGKERDVTFALGSYDDQAAGAFNLIYGIESFIHSGEPSRTVRRLASRLKPGGLMIIVDDMPANPFPKRYAGCLATFKATWRCPVMPTADQWTAHLEGAGCAVEATHDLTYLMEPRSEAEIDLELANLTRRRRWRDPLGLRLVGEAQVGGLVLERLTRVRAVLYTMIVARKL